MINSHSSSFSESAILCLSNMSKLSSSLSWQMKHKASYVHVLGEILLNQPPRQCRMKPQEKKKLRGSEPSLVGSWETGSYTSIINACVVQGPVAPSPWGLSFKPAVLWRSMATTLREPYKKLLISYPSGRVGGLSYRGTINSPEGEKNQARGVKKLMSN